MTDLILPPQLKIANASVKYKDNTGMSVGTYNGTILTAALGGDKLGMSITFATSGGGDPTSQERSALLQSFLARLRGKQNRFYSSDPSYRRAGSFPAVELITNPWFANGTTGWTASGQISLTASRCALRPTRTSVANAQTVSSPALTVTNGAAYAARMMAGAGKGVMLYRVAVGSSQGGTDLMQQASDQTAPALATIATGVSGTTAYLSLQDKVTGRAINDFMELTYASLSRCALVKGANQAGSTLVVDALPVSTTGLLLAGDQFEVITSHGSELKIVTSALNSDSSGEGTLMFEPPLRGVVSDNAAVIIHNPMGRWVFIGQAPEWMNEPGVFSSATLDFEEAA